MSQTYLGKTVRDEFPIFRNNRRLISGIEYPLTYLDSAVTTLKPQAVIDAMSYYLEHDYGSVHRGTYRLSQISSDLYEQVRAQVARFVGSSITPEQVIFTHGTTESLNIVANGFSHGILTESSRIVTSVLEHHANLVPWQQAALHSNCEISYIGVDPGETGPITLDLNQAERLITPNTKVVAFSLVGNILGQQQPVQELVALAKRYGAYVVVDCAQSIASIDDDLFAQGVDAIAFSGHKMYGPSGVGILVLTKDLAKLLPPFVFGGGMIASVALEGSSWAPCPAKFEAGTPPMTEVVGLGAAVSWLESINRKRLHEHMVPLANVFVEGLKKLPNIKILNSQDKNRAIVSFYHTRIHAHDFATALDASNIAMRAGKNCAWPLMKAFGVEALVRCSFGAYSDTDDVERALEAIQKINLML